MSVIEPVTSNRIFCWRLSRRSMVRSHMGKFHARSNIEIVLRFRNLRAPARVAFLPRGVKEPHFASDKSYKIATYRGKTVTEVVAQCFLKAVVWTSQRRWRKLLNHWTRTNHRRHQWSDRCANAVADAGSCW